MSYREADVSRLRTVPFEGRRNKVDSATMAASPGTDRSFAAFLAALPDVLAARDLRTIIAHVAAAKGAGKGVVLLLGGHVVKCGLGPLVGRWIERGIVSHVAMNGGAAIHDFELAAFGATSEDVKSGLGDGSFGMVEETGAWMNEAIARAAHAGQGLGEGLAADLAARKDLPGSDSSILLACHRAQVPVTVHMVLGAEIIHQHPSADGAAIGAAGQRDFRRLAGSLPAMSGGGAVLNLGSAVVMPELFLKALTVARNLEGGRPVEFLAADFDMLRHYRPRMNVVERPTQGTGLGISITGHHEIMLPLLIWGVLATLDAG